MARGVALFAASALVLFVADGSRQPTSGRDWRILGYQRGVASTASVTPVPDMPTLLEAFDSMLLDDQPPDVFATTRVFWFTATGSFGCPAHFAGLDVDAGAHLVTAVFTRAVTSGCDDKAVPDSFIIAIDRDRLPPAPYRVVLRNPAAPPTDDGLEVGS